MNWVWAATFCASHIVFLVLYDTIKDEYHWRKFCRNRERLQREYSDDYYTWPCSDSDSDYTED